MTTSYLLAPAVLPGDPFNSISRVTQLITAGKLLSMPVGMTTLGTDQSQEMEFVKVNLQKSKNR